MLHWALAAAFLFCAFALWMGSRKKERKAVSYAAIVLLLVAAGVNAYSALPRRPRPRLDVRNAGSNAILLRLGGDDLVVEPGETGQFRYTPGDAVTVFADRAGAGASSTLTLPDDGALDRERVAATANADDPEPIVFQLDAK